MPNHSDLSSFTFHVHEESGKDVTKLKSEPKEGGLTVPSLFSTHSLPPESLPTIVELKEAGAGKENKYSTDSPTANMRGDESRGEVGRHLLQVSVEQDLAGSVDSDGHGESESTTTPTTSMLHTHPTASPTDSTPADENDERREVGSSSDDLSSIQTSNEKEQCTSKSAAEDKGEEGGRRSGKCKWLKELSAQAELETMSILYAKSILEPQSTNCLEARVAIGLAPQAPPNPTSPTKEASNYVSPKSTQPTNTQTHSPSTEPRTVPKKPERAILREGGGTSPAPIRNRSITHNVGGTINQAPSPSFPTVNVTRQSWKPAPNRLKSPPLPVKAHLPARGPRIIGNLACETLKEAAGRSSYTGCASTLARSAPATDGKIWRRTMEDPNLSPNDYSKLPSITYEPKFQYRHGASARQRRSRIVSPSPAFRHSIRINEEEGEEEEEEQADTGTIRRPQKGNRRGPLQGGSALSSCADEKAPSYSPKTPDSVSTSSDSGQHSGSGAMEPSPPSNIPPPPRYHMVRFAERTPDCWGRFGSEFPLYCTYPRIAGDLDSLLVSADMLISLSAAAPTHNELVAMELVNRTEEFMALMRRVVPTTGRAPSGWNEWIVETIGEWRRTISGGAGSVGGRRQLPDRFYMAVRRMVLSTLAVYVKIIARYLSECSNKDRLLPIALSHLVRMLLLGGDELALEAIKSDTIGNIVAFAKMASIPTETLRILLRALAVLLSSNSGCLELLSIGGLELVLHHLRHARHDCSMEAAGVLTQLTNLGHSFVRLGDRLGHVLLRLLSLVDTCTTSESMLLCCAAISNLSLQDATSATQLLYQHNAILRLAKASKRIPLMSLPVQEQMATIFSRLANAGYEEALIAQGAIPFLLRMLTVEDAKHADFCKRIRYKAAVCLGSVSSTGVGLKAIFESGGYNEVCEAMRMEDQRASPLQLICSTVKQKIESTYEIESAV